MYEEAFSYEYQCFHLELSIIESGMCDVLKGKGKGWVNISTSGGLKVFEHE